MKIKVAFLYALLTTLVCLSTALAEPECSSVSKEVKMGSTTASASAFANLLGWKGTVRHESSEMFSAARAIYGTGARPENFCPASCQLSETPHMIFRSIPNKFRSKYSDAEKCEVHLAQTESNPLMYTKTLSHGVDSIEDWIGEFSQGKGDEGKKLYKTCDGSCSPQFSYQFKFVADQTDVEARVVCGKARDKRDNHYIISYSFLWSCERKVSRESGPSI